jgi:hypothetical protein
MSIVIADQQSERAPRGSPANGSRSWIESTFFQGHEKADARVLNQKVDNFVLESARRRISFCCSLKSR